MSWVKTYFEIKGTSDTIDLLKEQLTVNDVFTVHKLIYIPLELLTKEDSLVSETIMFLNYLEETGFGVLEFTMRDLYRDNIIHYLESNELSSLTEMVTTDLQNKIVYLDTPFTKYLEVYHEELSDRVIQSIKNYRETGHYDSTSFYIENIGSGSHPVNSTLVFTDTAIKGSFLTTMCSPILFFEYLKNTFDVSVSVSFLDMDSEEYITLLPDLSFPD